MADRRTQNCEARRFKKSFPKNTKPNNNCHLAEGKKPTSLSSLIVWNVSKAMEKNPRMDIKSAIKAAHERLADSRDVHAAISKSSEQRHFTCAMLAWQQLGHSDTDSLYHFIEVKIKEQEEKEEEQSMETYSLYSNEAPSPPDGSCVCNELLTFSNGVLSASIGSDSVGPVIKLPVEPQIVMRAQGKRCNNCQAKGPKPPTTPVPILTPKIEPVSSCTKDKLAAACNKTGSCDSRLICLDREIDSLRRRAAMLAKREKERVELLNRAEEAWMDLERGYQRRLMLAEEKEEEYMKQVKILADPHGKNGSRQRSNRRARWTHDAPEAFWYERRFEQQIEQEACKNACNLLTIDAKNTKDNNEAQKIALSDLEKELCELSCQKMKLIKEASRIDAELGEYQCKTSQLDRDVQFKEEQARRKMQAIQNDLESSQTITNETERALREELCALKVQVQQVSKQLLEEDAQNFVIIKEIEDLRQEKMGMVEDLEGCQEKCDSRMEGKIEELKKKQEEYAKLNEKVTECRCKLPVDVVVEAKRTPSLAALCHCGSEDKILKSCSCTSMRSRLMSTLLSDLFSGLQSEMGGAGQQMPCQMLKCLEDKHNWDKASVVKTNLENYFDKLMIGELDIAIATSIEKYHAKWVGTSCADHVTPKRQDNEWQQRAIERRAQNLAQGLAEQLFEQRAEELEQRAKDIVTSGPPPCECIPSRDSQNSKPGGKCRDETAYPVLTSVRLSKLPQKIVTPPIRRIAEPIPLRTSWQSAMQDVTKLKKQMEYLTKESIKKADLKRMEENITKVMQQSSLAVSEVPVDTNENAVSKDITTKKEVKNKRVCDPDYYINLQRSVTHTKSYMKPKTPKSILKQSNDNGNSSKPCRKLGNNYAINMCMCSQRRAKKKLLNSEVDAEKKDNKTTTSVKQTKPINSSSQAQPKSNRKCNGVCFHKAPSNTSIDQLLATLVKWNKDHSSSENEKDFCSLLPEGCPLAYIAKNKKNEDAADTNLESINALGRTSSPTKKLTGQIEGSRSRSDYKSSEINKRPSNDTDIDKSSNVMNIAQKTSSKKSEIIPINNFGKNLSFKKKSSTNLNKDSTINKCPGSVQLSIEDDAGVLSPTETSQHNTEKQKHCQGRCSVITKSTSDGIDEAKNIQRFDNKRDIAERDIDVIQPTESKYIREINYDKSVEEDSKTEQKRNYLLSEDKMINRDNVRIGDTKTNVNNESIKMQRDSKTKNPSDSYDIKFLGVTLTDVTSQNQENTDKQYVIGDKKKSAKNNNDITITLDTNEEAGDQGDSQSVKETTSCKLTENFDPNYKLTMETKGGKSEISVKKCIERIFQSQQTNADKGLSTQHFEEVHKQDTPCVCCNYNNMDGSEDLEENTFHLIEEHLKNKLQEFKLTSCNDTCIPSEEEEKIFTAILSRVKKVIVEGTNKITCKCSKEEGTPQGSWNRAYGLLQEYLKTKIKRVQCSCVLAEENNDTILPDVLDKVFHLIEYDFKRLQDICGCKMALDPPNSKVYFKEEVPERDKHFQNGVNTGLYGDAPNNTPNSINKKEKNLDYEMFLDNAQNLEAQQNLILGKDSIILDEDNFFGLRITKPSANKKYNQKYNLPYADCICTNFECAVNGLPHKNNETDLTKCIHDANVSGKRTPILNPINIQVSSDQVKRSSHKLHKETETLLDKTSKADKIADTDFLIDTNAQSDSINKTVAQCTCCSCTNKTTPLSLGEGFRPYIGYTIDCSCDNTLGPCYCAKSVFRAKKYDMDNIFRKCLPKEHVYNVYDYKVEEGFTMDKKVLHTQSLSELQDGDFFLNKILHNKSNASNHVLQKDDETEASIREADGLLLKYSRARFTKTDNKANTCEDVASSTGSSPHWCNSRMYHGVSQSDQLSQSCYNPDDFENSVDYKNDNTASSSDFAENCRCDMVPICHVKMLVENIEKRLVTANCTCDSMIPQVCPIHSTR